MWTLLGIDPTDDLKKIKRAYARQLKQYHPEDDPDGFQRLHEAYQSAQLYAKQGGGYDEWDDDEEDDEEWIPASPTLTPDMSMDEWLLRERGEHPNVPEDEAWEEDAPPQAPYCRPFDERWNEQEQAHEYSIAIDLTPESSLEEWEALFQQVASQGIARKGDFEHVLIGKLFTPTEGRRTLPFGRRKKITLAEQLSPEVFNLIEQYFGWKNDEGRVAPWLEEHFGASLRVFYNCLYRLKKPNKAELLIALESFLSDSSQVSSHAAWQTFFRNAQMLEQRKRFSVGRKAFRVLVRNYPTCGMLITLKQLNGLDRLFGWTRSVYGDDKVWLTWGCHRELNAASAELENLLIQARDYSSAKTVIANHRRSLVRIAILVALWGGVFLPFLAVTAVTLTPVASVVIVVMVYSGRRGWWQADVEE